MAVCYLDGFGTSDAVLEGESDDAEVPFGIALSRVDPACAAAWAQYGEPCD